MLNTHGGVIALLAIKYTTKNSRVRVRTYVCISTHTYTHSHTLLHTRNMRYSLCVPFSNLVSPENRCKFQMAELQMSLMYEQTQHYNKQHQKRNAGNGTVATRPQKEYHKNAKLS